MADSDSRTLMLVGAINAFREHGIATTSLTEIVERSGAPRGSVYHYFPEGKGQLAGEAVAYFGRGVSAAISSMIAQSSPPEIIDAVVTIFRNSLVESDFTSSCPVAAAAVEGASTPAALTAAGRILHLVGIASHIVLLAAGTAVRDCSTVGNRRDRVNRRRDADGKSSAHHGASRSHRRSPQGSGLGPELTNPSFFQPLLPSAQEQRWRTNMSHTLAPAPSAPMMTKSRRFTALIFICLAELLVVLDNTVVNVALPTMSVDLFASVSDLQWIVDAYTLTFAGFLLTFGHLGDRFGRRRVMIIGLIGVGAMSLVGALASNLEQVIMARAAMGVFAAAVFPATLAMITNIFTDARERAIAIAAWTAMAGFAIAIGPTAGGWLLEHFSWHSVFWMNVPAALLVIVGVLLVVPESKALHVGRFDFVGTILSLLGIVILVWTIIDAPHRGWVSTFSITGYLSATVLLAAFVAWELRTDAPILNMNLFRIRRFSSPPWLLRSATSVCSGSCS